jgi:hypothetical protein
MFASGDRPPAPMMRAQKAAVVAMAFLALPIAFWRWCNRRRPVHRPTFFEIEYTDNGGYVLRALTPEARAWAEKFLHDSRLPDGNYLVSRAIVGGVIARAKDRGYVVRMV